MKIIQAFACFVLPIIVMMVWSPSVHEKRNMSYALFWMGMNYISRVEACFMGGFFIVAGLFAFASDP